MEYSNSFMGINQRNINRSIWIISIAVPLIVIALFQIQIDYSLPFLPYVNAVINSITLICIWSAFFLIRKGNRLWHRRLMSTALILSILFLLSYLLYHAGSEEAKFGGEGSIRYVYFFLLITHILLSAIVIPLVLISFIRARMGDFEKHKRIAKFTFWVWTYVLVSGITVFLMIRPYY